MQSKAAAVTSLMLTRWIHGHGGVVDASLMAALDAGGAMVATVYSTEGPRCGAFGSRRRSDPGKVGLQFVLPSSSISPSLWFLFICLEHVHVLSDTAGFAMEISLYKLLHFTFSCFSARSLSTIVWYYTVQLYYVHISFLNSTQSLNTTVKLTDRTRPALWN
jgi:hypothetical protein